MSQRRIFPRFPVSLPRHERAELVAELKHKLPHSTHAEIAGALRLASALLEPAVNRSRLVRAAEVLLDPH